MKRQLIITLVIVVLVIVGVLVYVSVAGNDDKYNVQNREDCLSLRGKWAILGNPLPGTGVPECILPTSDAGEECTDSSQCESWCQAPEGSESGASVVGTCYAWEKDDCSQEVMGGIAQTGVCV